MSRSAMEVFLIITIALLTAPSAGQSCGTIGSLSTTAFTPQTSSAFYLNIDERTTCSGAVSELNLSFYNVPSDPGLTTLIAYVSFYRPESLNKDNFIKVREEIEVQITDFSSVAASNGNLHSVVFPLSREVLVEEDTLLGVCIPGNTPEGTQPLQAVSRDVTGVVNDRLLVGLCDLNRLPERVGLMDFESRRNILLHIYASVNVGSIITAPASRNTTVTTATRNDVSLTTAITNETKDTTDGIDTTAASGVITGVVVTISGVGILLSCSLVLASLRRKLIVAGECCRRGGKPMNEVDPDGKIENPKIVLSNTDSTGEELHYSLSLPLRGQTSVQSSLQNIIQPGSGSLVHSHGAVFQQYDDENYAIPTANPEAQTNSLDLQYNPNYSSNVHHMRDNRSYRSNSHHSIDLQDNRSHHSIDLQDNRSYCSNSHHSIDLQDNRSYSLHSIDLQDNRSYCSNSHSIDLQDNRSYCLHSIDLQDNRSNCSNSLDLDMQDNLSYNSLDFGKVVPCKGNDVHFGVEKSQAYDDKV